MAELVSVTKDVWVAKAPLALPGGIEVGATMTVVRLADRGLWIHSPIPLNQALVTELDALGEVRWIVAPNLLHHLFLGAAKARYPNAETFGSEALQTKRADLTFDRTLHADTEFPDMLTLPIHGAPKLQETVFYHHPSRTLITTDLFFNIKEPKNWRTAVILWMIGDYPGIRQGFVLRVFAKDRSAWKASMAKLFALPFENLLMAHGSPVCGDARAQAWATCAWGLPSESISMLRAGDKS